MLMTTRTTYADEDDRCMTMAMLMMKTRVTCEVKSSQIRSSCFLLCGRRAAVKVKEPERLDRSPRSRNNQARVATILRGVTTEAMVRQILSSKIESMVGMCGMSSSMSMSVKLCIHTLDHCSVPMGWLVRHGCLGLFSRSQNCYGLLLTAASS